MPIVYVDVLVALNWLIDFLLLSATAAFLHLPVTRFRVAIGGFLGGVYALVLLLPKLAVPIRLSADVAVAVLMTVVAFPRCRWSVLLKRAFAFFAVSTMFFGAVSLLYRILDGEYIQTHNGQVYAALSPLMLTAFTVISYVAVCVFERLTARRIPKQGEYQITVSDGASSYQVRALYDSGMRLREPFSGAPVIVMERERILPLLSQDVQAALEEKSAHPRVRWIPCQTVSGEGLLPAFRPKTVRVKRLGEQEQDISGVYVAFCKELGCGEYEALVNDDCCEGWNR